MVNMDIVDMDDSDNKNNNNEDNSNEDNDNNEDNENDTSKCVSRLPDHFGDTSGLANHSIITKNSKEIDRQENYNQDNNNEDNSIMKTMTVKTTATGSDMPSTSCVIQRPNFGVNSIY